MRVGGREWAATPCHLLGAKHAYFDTMRKGRITSKGKVLSVLKCSRCGSETERVRERPNEEVRGEGVEVDYPPETAMGVPDDGPT